MWGKYRLVLSNDQYSNQPPPKYWWAFGPLGTAYVLGSKQKAENKVLEPHGLFVFSDQRFSFTSRQSKSLDWRGWWFSKLNCKHFALDASAEVSLVAVESSSVFTTSRLFHPSVTLWSTRSSHGCAKGLTCPFLFQFQFQHALLSLHAPSPQSLIFDEVDLSDASVAESSTKNVNNSFTVSGTLACACDWIVNYRLFSLRERFQVI